MSGQLTIPGRQHIRHARRDAAEPATQSRQPSGDALGHDAQRGRPPRGPGQSRHPRTPERCPSLRPERPALQLFLDRDRQYSCADFPRGNETLEEAQIAKKRHIAAKLCLNRPGLRVLDIGCGWGGMALALGARFRRPGHRYHAVAGTIGPRRAPAQPAEGSKTVSGDLGAEIARQGERHATPQPQPMSSTRRPGRLRHSFAAIWRFLAICASSSVSLPRGKIGAGILPVTVSTGCTASRQVVVMGNVAPRLYGPRGGRPALSRRGR